MAVKKANTTKENKEVEVKVETPVVEVSENTEAVQTPDVEPVETKSEENEADPTVEQGEEKEPENDTETPVVEVEEPQAVEEPNIQVDETPVDATKQAKKNVRIRMRVDHKCWVGSEVYDLHKGQCYAVPLSVKMRLNKAGVLLPL